jgi:hypothetical protein
MQQVIDTYTQIMGSLATLPDEIAGYQEDLTNAKMGKADADRALAQHESDVIVAAGGWKALGGNEKERELAAAQLCRNNAKYATLTSQQATLQRTVAEMADELAAAERQYGAVCYMARLHSALMTYLGNAGAPVNLSDLVLQTPTGGGKTMPAMYYAGLNGAATVADAEALGL